MRTSTSQFQLLVDYMQKHGDLSKPNDGPHGKATNLRQWAELTKLLNADATGDTKSIEKWRKEEVTELTVLPTLDQPTDDSPSIFLIHEQFGQQTCSNVEDWNRPGTSAQPTVFPPLPADRNNQDLAGREAPAIVNSPDRSEAGMTQAEEPATQAARTAAGGRQHAPQSPTPLPLTPRRRRTRPMPTLSSPTYRRTRTHTQSDLARQAFLRSDCEWRNFQMEAERERNRLRELEIRMQERWLDLFSQFLVLGNRIVDNWEKK
ncbi:uncharacterized protein LOC134749911 [Cydia strobilella]|uniref:uncharacterized protein LOC134748887 n=1 Tax=Cydia strobilella TaxID=1100964 RepID=UPI0030041A59